jgi:hypothetical protein
MFLEEYYNIIEGGGGVSEDIRDKLRIVAKLFNLELGYYNIEGNVDEVDNKRLLRWLIVKIKSRVSDI